MKQHLIIVAGGSGTRMNSVVPKQFIELEGKAILIWTLEKFLSYDPNMNVIIAVHHDYKEKLGELLLLANLNLPNIKITIGGASRFESVKNGLACLANESGVVGIHDAARPLVSIKTITNCYETAAIKGNAIPCMPIHESLRQTNGNSNEVVNRDKFRIIQTPQCFKLEEILHAFKQPYSERFTDDATVLETTGAKINLVEGNIENIKITTAADLIIAKAFCNHEQ